jgi:hypothetical protein
LCSLYLALWAYQWQQRASVLHRLCLPGSLHAWHSVASSKRGLRSTCLHVVLGWALLCSLYLALWAYQWQQRASVLHRLCLSGSLHAWHSVASSKYGLGNNHHSILFLLLYCLDY